jgi:hypothetical protein
MAGDEREKLSEAHPMNNSGDAVYCYVNNSSI